MTRKIYPNPYTEPTLPNSPFNSTHPAPSSEVRIGYLLSRYPAISHTFFLKEVLGLRERGLVVDVASINRPDREKRNLPEVEASEVDQTFYVKSGNLAAMAFRVMTIALSHPGTAFRGLLAALCLGDWNLKSHAFALFYFAEALLVGQWMRSHRLNHLHVHFGGPVATVGMLAAKAWRIPWSITLHGPDEFFDQEIFYLRQKIESADFVICISSFCRSQVLRIVPGLDESKVEVIRLGVDCDALQPKEANPAFSAGPIQVEAGTVRLVCTGRMVAAKGHRILLEALTLLSNEGVDFTCALIGDGPERGSLESQCHTWGISKQVHFLGAMAHQPTLAQVADADVFVLASFAEGLPVALMEAMALGVPCVSTTIAAIPELIDSRGNGLLVSPADPVMLCGALKQLINNVSFRRELGTRARETVEESYNLSRNLDALAQMWSRRLDGSR